MISAVDFLGHSVKDGDVLVRSIRDGNKGRMRVSYVLDAKAGKVHSFGWTINGGKGVVNDYDTSIVVSYDLLPKQFKDKIDNLRKKLELEQEVGNNFA